MYFCVQLLNSRDRAYKSLSEPSTFQLHDSPRARSMRQGCTVHVRSEPLSSSLSSRAFAIAFERYRSSSWPAQQESAAEIERCTSSVAIRCMKRSQGQSNKKGGARPRLRSLLFLLSSPSSSRDTASSSSSCSPSPSRRSLQSRRRHLQAGRLLLLLLIGRHDVVESSHRLLQLRQQHIRQE